MTEYLGKYRIDSVLGKGAMGVVYSAYDPFIQRVVALKTIRKELLGDVERCDMVERFKHEARAAGRLNHPNIVAVYDYGEDGASAYIAMEYVDGTSLGNLLVNERPTALPRAAMWMANLLRALSYAHAQGVVHRDIKPANVLITRMGQVKMSDFGIARIESSTLTQIGSMIGTPSYMSPEQIRGMPVDGRSDVFSAAVVLYQLLTGWRPFTGSSVVVMQQILTEQPAPVSLLNPAIGQPYDRVVEKAMAKAAQDRYMSAQAFLEALEAAQQESGVDPDATTLVLEEHLLPAYVEPDWVARQSFMGSFSTAPGTGIQTVTPWKQEAFPELEVILTQQLGPIARLLLRKACAQADGIDDLCEWLLPHIPQQVGRDQFQLAVARVRHKLNANGTRTGTSTNTWACSQPFGTSSTAPMVTHGTRGPVQQAFDQDYADTMAQHLTVFIGPIARTVVRRATCQTHDKVIFLSLLAKHIEAAADRDKFLIGARSV